MLIIIQLFKEKMFNKIIKISLKSKFKITLIRVRIRRVKKFLSLSIILKEVSDYKSYRVINNLISGLKINT